MTTDNLAASAAPTSSAGALWAPQGVTAAVVTKTPAWDRALPFVGPMLLLLLWDMVVPFGWVKAILLPPPTDTVLLLTKRPTKVAEILHYGDARPRTTETLSEPSFITAKKRSLEIFQREERRSNHGKKAEHMNEADVLNYVKGTAVLLGVPMDAARAASVMTHLQRTAAMAALLDAANLSVDDELAEIYCPAAFKSDEFGCKQL